MRYVVAICAVALLRRRRGGRRDAHTLALAGRSPVVVVGTGFARARLVRVSVTAGGSTRRGSSVLHTRGRVRFQMAAVGAPALWYS